MTSHTAAAQVELRVQELLATPQGKARTAEYLARLEIGRYDLAGFVDEMLPRLAPQWDDMPEERNARFEALQDAVRTGVSVFVDDAVDALVEARPDPAVFNDITPDPSLPRRPRLACEADTGGDQ
jgi:hypothetical protein